MEKVERVNIIEEGILKNVELNIFGINKPKQNEVKEKNINSNVALVYGKNGEGKTTISNSLANLKLDSESCLLIDSNYHLKNLKIYMFIMKHLLIEM